MIGVHYLKFIMDDSSSESDNEESQELLAKTLSGYWSELSGVEENSTSILQVTLYDNSCLICLSRIKRVQAVWNCALCYTSFHLVCIQHWAKDGIESRNSVLSEVLFPGIQSKWTCPKCRVAYNRADVPSVYTCFCGKRVDPPADPWLLAHSCGEVCGRALKGNCGHKCLSLCHPGACPPCPKTMILKCHCGRGPVKPQRCGLPGWSCGEVCGYTLSCGFHTCERLCHEGVCPPCDQRVVQPCVCGKEMKDQPCDQPQWSCKQVCSRLLPCQKHFCQKVCHSGSCGNCPRIGKKFCPCGKRSYVLQDCTTDVTCCGDTCSQALACGKHKCMRRCHLGDCGPCVQMTEKFCKCGLKKKSVSCSQEFSCDNKCQSMKQCGRHMCRKKCCGGNCGSCERTCSRPLPCRNHKCSAPCHSGRCYPCVLTVSVTCACGLTSVDVPCGRERATKPPGCSQMCQLPPTCHHLHPVPHACHFGECPPCTHVCSLPLACNHLCTATCHSRPVCPSQSRPTAPWKKVEKSLIVKPCPPCKQLITKRCYGGHEVQMFACSEVGCFSCGRVCGRLLECGNHTCLRSCHVVTNASDVNSAGEECFACERMCEKPRHPDCQHHCPQFCHKGECLPCDSMMKFSCHCSSMDVYIKCSEWCAADERTKENMKSCNGQCSKMLSCGHRCPQSCHPGPCTALGGHCRRKITVRCPCRRLKKEWQCCEQQEVTCNEECMLAIEQQNEANNRAVAEAVALKEKEEKKALSLLEMQLRPRKRKRKLKQVDHPLPTVPFYATRCFKLFVGCVLILTIVLISITIVK